MVSPINVNSNGNVGIGTTTPTTALQVFGLSNSTWMTEYYIPPTEDTYFSVLSSNGYMDNLRTMIEVGSSGTGVGNFGSVYKYLFGFSNTGTVNGGNFIIQSMASSTTSYEIAAAANTRFTIRYDGNVGIGVANPLYALHINNTYNEANQTGILGTGVGQRMTSGIKVGELHIGSAFPTNGPVIWSETGLTIQASNGTVGMPRNNLDVGGNIIAAGNLNVTGSVNMPGLVNTGSATLAALTCTGNSIFSGGASLTVTGGLSVSGSVSVNGSVNTAHVQTNTMGRIYNANTGSVTGNYPFFRGTFNDISPSVSINGINHQRFTSFIPPFINAVYCVYVTRAGASRGYSIHYILTWDSGANGEWVSGGVRGWATKRIHDANNGYWDDYVGIMRSDGNWANLDENNGYIAVWGENSAVNISITQIA